MKKIGTDAYCFDTHGHTALLTSARLILVDTGTQPDGSILFPEIEKTGYKISDIEHIIITHTHPDHVGGLAKLKELTNASIAAHELERKYISKKEIYQGPPGPASQWHPGTVVDVGLTDGQIYEGLLVIHTPGHTPGHIALLDKENSLLLAGDSFRHDPTGFAPMPDQYNIDPHQHRESIKKMMDFSFDRVIFGHGDPVDGNAKSMFKTLVDNL